jgi:hypothetical protein
MKRIQGFLFLVISVYFLISAFTSPELVAQLKRCDYCKGQITGTFIYVQGKYFHPEHFLCKRCGKQIQGSYQEILGEYYHPECFTAETEVKCAWCNKPIIGEFVTIDLKPYHPDCYRNNVEGKCSVCNQPLTDEYQVDVYGNKFCTSHSILDKCDNCGRLICNMLTNGGVTYKDGRHICNICYNKAVFKESEIKGLLLKVIDKLVYMGINLKKECVSIEAVNKTELKVIANMEKFNALEGFCYSGSAKYISGKLKKTLFTHKIYVLNGIPALSLEVIIAHELMHAWLAENTTGKHPPDEIEGSCNYISYLYLLTSTDPEAKFYIKRMELNSDPVYGKGYLKIKKRFQSKPLSTLLDFLKIS